MKIMIGIPARYNSTRFPGKPLAMINGRTMLDRVVNKAKRASKSLNELASYINVSYFVTTDDQRIADHATNDLSTNVIMTPANCKTGTDRLLAALRQMDHDWPDFIVNLQGDAPFMPILVIESLIKYYIKHPEVDVVTPLHHLNWESLDALRASKQRSPFTGTTAIINQYGEAVWFSKSIMPAMRDEQKMREAGETCPVYQHMGIYGYTPQTLEKFCSLPQSHYEKIEQLEQLRFIENGITINTLQVEVGKGLIQSGIDTPEDVKAAEEFLATRGESQT